MMCKIDTYVQNEKIIHYPFRYLHLSIKTSHFKEAVWFCVNDKCCVDRNYDVGVTLRQVFDPILSGHDTYSETDSVYNSFRRPSDFDISGCSLREIVENIKLNSDIVIVKFEFVYNPLCINRMLDFVHDTTNEYPKCVQTLLMVTNSLHDVEGIKTATSNVVGKIAIGTNCMDMLQMLEYNVLGHKYVIVCDAASKNSEYTTPHHEQTRCICPYYVIKIESKSKMVPQLQNHNFCLRRNISSKNLACGAFFCVQNLCDIPDLYETKCLCDFCYSVENKRTLGRPTFNRIQSENDRNQILIDHNDTTCKKQQ